MQSRNSANSQGIDISHHNGYVDWQKVSNTNIKFVIMKASESTRTVDDKLTENYEGARSVGLPVGFYHFAHVSNDPIKEANFYLSIVEGLTVDLWHVLDLENGSLDDGGYSKAYVSDWARQWLKRVTECTGKAPMIYTGGSFARTYLESDLSVYPLWVAHYGTDTPMSNPVWSAWTIFQYSESGHIDGIADNAVDLNEFHCDINEFMKKSEVTEDESNMPMKLEDWQWKMLYDVMGAAYNVDKLNWDWMQKVVDKTLTASELAFINTVLDGRIDRNIQV